MSSAAGLQAPATRGSNAALVVHQARYEMRAYWRNTRARIFTLAVPVALLLILVALFGGNGSATAGGHKLKIGAYYAPTSPPWRSSGPPWSTC